MRRLEAILFDVDGTLADTERDGHRVAFNAAFRDLGLDWNWSEAVYGELLAVTGGKERIRHYLSYQEPGLESTVDLDALVIELHRRKTEHYLRLVGQAGIPLRAGVARLLREARASGIRLAIATTTTPANVTALLQSSSEAGLLDWFEVIAAGDDVPAKKPAPDIYDLVLSRLDLPPSACVVLEDSYNGLRAALAAGLRAVVITPSAYTLSEDFSGAALVVEDLGEPGAPARPIHGTLGRQCCVDVATLERVRADSYRG